MQMPKWCYVVIALSPVLLVGCESNADKLKALQHEQTIACLEDNSPNHGCRGSAENGLGESSNSGAKTGYD